LLIFSNGRVVLKELERRRSFSHRNLQKLVSAENIATDLIDGKACVYATGSFGRGEASDGSDLDLFIVGRSESSDGGDKSPPQRLLKRLDEVCLKADLIRATEKLGLPEFDGDGEYLKHHSIIELVETLGKPTDDSSNTFTARMLLLLESAPIFEEDVYSEAVDQVIEKYWRDWDDHKSNFSPSFLLNDILRLWRTFCVNYEARTSSFPAPKKIKRRIKNYKLKQSRMLTCYSAVLGLLATVRMKGTVSQVDFKDLVMRSPTKRLEWIADLDLSAECTTKVRTLLDKYVRFLERTNLPSEALQKKFSDDASRSELMTEAEDFSQTMYDAIMEVGETDGRLLRYVVA